MTNTDLAREAARKGNGEFGTQEHGLPENGLSRPYIQALPSGVSVALEEMPDVAAWRPQVGKLDNGDFHITYVQSEHWPDADGVTSVAQIMRQADIKPYDSDSDPYTGLCDHAFQTGDLSRAVMLVKSADRPGEYDATVLGHEFFDNGGDTDDWKKADAALIFPEDRNAEEEIDGWMDDINTFGREKKTYTVHSELRSPDGRLKSHFVTDGKDGVFTEGDADAHAVSVHGDPAMTFDQD